MDCSDQELSKITGSIECDSANQLLHVWDGIITSKFGNLIINHKNLLLKGSHLKNTEYAIGIVIYTGNSPKILMNNSLNKVKKTTKIFRSMNSQFLYLISQFV